MQKLSIICSHTELSSTIELPTRQLKKGCTERKNRSLSLAVHNVLSNYVISDDFSEDCLMTGASVHNCVQNFDNGNAPQEDQMDKFSMTHTSKFWISL